MGLLRVLLPLTSDSGSLSRTPPSQLGRAPASAHMPRSAVRTRRSTASQPGTVRTRRAPASTGVQVDSPALCMSRWSGQAPPAPCQRARVSRARSTCAAGCLLSRQRAAAATCGCARAPSRSIVRQEPLLASFRRGGGGRWRNGHGAVQRGGPLAVQCTDAAYGPLKLPAWLEVLHVLG